MSFTSYWWIKVQRIFTTMFASVLNILSPESIYRVKRYDNGKHLTKILKEGWIDKASEEKGHFSVEGVFGELDSLYVIHDTVNAIKKGKCDYLQVIFGPKLDSNRIKRELKSILEENRQLVKNNKIKIFSLNERPVFHSVRIKNNYLYEDKHPHGKEFEWSTAIVNANIDTQRAYTKYINKLLDNNPKRITADNIDSIEVYKILITADSIDSIEVCK